MEEIKFFVNFMRVWKGVLKLQRNYIYLLALGHFASDVSMGALPAILPFFISQYGMDYKSVAGLMFASCFLSSVIQPAFGWLADKKSKSWFMSLGIILAGVGIGLTGVFENYWMIFAVVTISGIGGAVFHPEAACMVNKLAGDRRGTALSIFSVGGNGGFAAGPLIAVAALSSFGLPGTTVFCVLSGGIALMLLFFVPKMKADIARAEAEKTQQAAAAKQEKAAGVNDWKAFSYLLVLLVFSSIAICGLRSFIPLYWVDVMGLSNAAAGSSLTLLFVFGVITTFVGGLLADRFGYLKIVKVSYVLLAVSVALFSQTRTIWIGLLLLLPMGFAMFAPFSSIVVLGQSYLARNIGFASGVTLGLSFSIGGVLVPLIGSFADVYGLSVTMQLLAFFAFLAGIAAFFLPVPGKKEADCKGQKALN